MAADPMPRIRERLRGLGRVLAVALAGLAPGCFDGEELTDGLRCQEDAHCGGSLECVMGYCRAVNGGDTDPIQGGEEGSVGLTNDPPPGGDDAPTECGYLYDSCSESGCCNEGVCVDYGNGIANCEISCGAGVDCGSCCCMRLQNGASACVETQYCGTEALCLGGCSSPGSACYSDADCCAGGRCLLNAGDWYSCFKPCVSPGECGSGCCNYNASAGGSFCESC